MKRRLNSRVDEDRRSERRKHMRFFCIYKLKAQELMVRKVSIVDGVVDTGEFVFSALSKFPGTLGLT